jgi:ATP-dependent helicase/nuclease subunit A
VSLHRKGTAKCHAQSIAEILDGAPYVPLDALTGAGDAAAELEDESDVRVRVRRSVDPDPVARDRWGAERAAQLVAAARPASVAATTLARAAAPDRTGEPLEADPGLAKDEPEVEQPAWKRGRAGTAIGRAVHAVLQTVDLASGEGLDATARAQALAEGVPDREVEIRRLAESARNAPIVRAAVEGGWRSWREVPVATEIDGVLLEGFVDLLLEQPDGELVVVDWKTDRVPAPAELDAALGRYSVQGAAYALALEAVLGRTVARCIFVFARAPGGAIEREVVDLRARVDAVRAGLGAAAGFGA